MRMSIILLSLILQGCSNDSDSYYPLNKEITWTYKISVSGFLIGRNTIETKLTNMENRELDGNKLTPQKFDISHN